MLPPTFVEGFHDPETVKKMEYKPLGSTGLMVSKLSLGGGAFGCHYGKYDEDEAVETIREALKMGVNYIDTGPWYGQGQSETLIGKALKGIPRAAYYIATKVGRYELDFENMFDYSVEKTRKSIKLSLERLGLDYVDVIQIHDIEFAPSLDIILCQTLPEVSRQVAAGKAKHIGITGYDISALKECIERSNINIRCVLTYARLTLIDDTLLGYVPFFEEQNIGVINAAAPAMGLLTNHGPPDWHPADEDVKAICSEAAEYCKSQDVEMGKLAVWHSVQFNEIATNLIGMQNLKLLNSNLDIVANGITEKEREVLSEIKDKYLSKLKRKHWEGVEVGAYRKALNK